MARRLRHILPKVDGFVIGSGAGANGDNVLTADGYWDTADVPLNGLIVFVVAKTDSSDSGTTLQQGYYPRQPIAASRS